MHGFITLERLQFLSRLALSSTSLAREPHIVRLIRVGLVLPPLHCFFFVLGGDPAAGSPTATLLRLNPPYEPQVRRDQHTITPHPKLIRVVRRAVCARSRDVFTAR